MKKVIRLTENDLEKIIERVISEQGANWTFTKMQLNSPNSEIGKQLIGQTINIFNITNTKTPYITFKPNSIFVGGDYELEDIFISGYGQVFPPKGEPPVTISSKNNNIKVSMIYDCKAGKVPLRSIEWTYIDGFDKGKKNKPYMDHLRFFDFDSTTKAKMISYCKKY